MARAVWQPRPNLTTSAEAWLIAGASHHTVLTTAVNRETLADFAEMAQVELLMIDANTNVRAFANEVRWNALSWRMADRTDRPHHPGARLCPRRPRGTVNRVSARNVRRDPTITV